MDGDIQELAGSDRAEAAPHGDADTAGEPGLRPALFACRRDLTRLRYDFPLVLVEGDAGDGFVRSLSAIVDGVLGELAPRGAQGEALRGPVLKLEQEIRTLTAHGAKGSLLQLWNQAASGLLSRADPTVREALAYALDRARAALPVDGMVIDCDGEAPLRLVTHAWAIVQAAKARTFHKRLEALIHKLGEILQADFMKTTGARSPEALRSSVGTAYEAAFDFEMMAKLLAREKINGRLSAARRERIDAALLVLRSQKFFAGRRHREKEDGYDFLFDSSAAALDAFRNRLPEAVKVVKAIAIADLEVENRYRDEAHDRYFDRFDASMLGPDDLAMFPTYLVRLRHGREDPVDTANVLDALASKLPMKFLVQTDDIPCASSLDLAQPSRGAGASSVASLALGLGDVYVLQTAGSSLYRLSGSILDGLNGDGPALFSVFTGTARGMSDIPPYLAAAAAEESRAFPAFAHDPAAGPDLASRFSVADNPQACSDWPVHDFSWEDDEHQRVAEELAFTFVDFAACDRRWEGHLEAVAPGERHDDLIPAADYLALENGAATGKVPYILMVDETDMLHRVMVDDRLIRAARRCAGQWRALQEMGGINNSHARLLVEQERESWEREREQERAELPARPAPEAAASPPVVDPVAATEPAAPPADAEAGEVSPDEAYIETPRCTTCNECTEINNRMFAYNEDMQAYIADVGAGTYRELVEATESCQVAIIHPGKPRNQNEPGLDELIERAEPFN